METIIYIVIGNIVGLSMLKYADITLEKEVVRKYIKDHWWCHPNAICIERAILGLIGMLIYFAHDYNITIIPQNIPIFLPPDYHFNIHLSSISEFLTQHYKIGIIPFTVAAYADGVDGKVARKCGLITTIGEWLDPLCDKILYLFPLTIFSYQHFLSTNLMIFFTEIELIGQFVIRNILAKAKKTLGANNYGKIKAAVAFGLVTYCAILKEGVDIFNISTEILAICIILAIASIVFKIPKDWYVALINNILESPSVIFKFFKIPEKFYANIYTTANGVCGLITMVFTYFDDLIIATFCFIACNIFDYCDGKMAKKYGGTPHGLLFDSYADAVSFGLAPAYLIIKVAQAPHASILGLAFVVAIWYRLIRYTKNDKTNQELPSGIFNGFPSPAAAAAIWGICLTWTDINILLIATITFAYLATSSCNFIHFNKINEWVPKKITIPVAIMSLMLFILATVKWDKKYFGYWMIITTIIYIIAGNIIARKKIAEKI